MGSNDSQLDQLNELPLTKEDQRLILRCLREGGVVDYHPVLAVYQLCRNNAVELATTPQRDNVGRRAAHTFLREALGVEALDHPR